MYENLHLKSVDFHWMKLKETSHSLKQEEEDRNFSRILEARWMKEKEWKTKGHKNKNMSMRNNLFENFHATLFLSLSLPLVSIVQPFLALPNRKKNCMISGD